MGSGHLTHVHFTRLLEIASQGISDQNVTLCHCTSSSPHEHDSGVGFLHALDAVGFDQLRTLLHNAAQDVTVSHGANQDVTVSHCANALVGNGVPLHSVRHAQIAAGR